MKGKIFNAQEMQSILNGSKTMFREVIKVQPKTNISSNMISFAEKLLAWSGGSKCPYQVGQKIFCKESFSSYYEDDGLVRGDIFLYRADEDSKELEDVDWKPAQHMKQEHSRLTLQIKEIKVERLADISEEDAIAEGINPNTITNINNYFRNLWNCTHKKPEEKFEASPFVFVYQFELIK